MILLILFVAKWNRGIDFSPRFLGAKARLDLLGQVFRVHLIDHALDRHQHPIPVLAVQAVIVIVDGYKSYAEQRKHLFQILTCFHEIAAQTREVLYHDAVDFPLLQCFQQPLKFRAIKICSRDAAQWFVTRLNTNGRLLTPALCQKLYDASLDSVQVTLYSHDKDIHNALVGADGFDDTVAGIRAAVAAGLSVSVNTPLCSLNTAYDEMLRFVHGLGVRYVTCSGLIPSGGAVGDESRATALTEQQLTDVLTKAVAVTEELEMELDFTSPGWLKEETLRALGLTLVPSCGACLSNMAVAPDGGVIPCQSWLSSQPLGNILADDWDKIWQSERCAAIRAKSAKMEQLCQLRQGNGEEASVC